MPGSQEIGGISPWLLLLGRLVWIVRALRGVSIVPSTVCAKNKNTPVTSWMNFFPALSNEGFLLIGLHFIVLCHISS